MIAGLRHLFFEKCRSLGFGNYLVQICVIYSSEIHVLSKTLSRTVFWSCENYANSHEVPYHTVCFSASKNVSARLSWKSVWTITEAIFSFHRHWQSDVSLEMFFVLGLGLMRCSSSSAESSGLLTPILDSLLLCTMDEWISVRVIVCLQLTERFPSKNICK